MGRPLAQGIEYFPMDVKFNDKIQLLEKECGLIGIAIWLKLLQRIYAKNFFLMWDERERLKTAMALNVDDNVLDNVINVCIKWDILDINAYRNYSALTSAGIQKRYFKIIKRRTSCTVVKELLLIDLDEIYRLCPTVNINIIELDLGVNVNINSVDVGVNDGIKTQSKVKESKVEKSKESKKEEKESSTDVEAQKEKKGDFISNLISRFQYEYQESRRREYVITNQGMERQAIGRLVGWWKKGHPENDSRQTAEGLQEFFKKCLAVSDQWHYDRISPAHIWSKLNELEIIINKTGAKNNGRTYREISVDELA